VHFHGAHDFALTVLVGPEEPLEGVARPIASFAPPPQTPVEGSKLGVALGLKAEQARVEATFFEEGVVAPLFVHLAALEHEDAIGHSYGGETMGDDEGGTAFGEGMEAVEDGVLAPLGTRKVPNATPASPAETSQKCLDSPTL
jgi:hypothetical protein